MPHRPSGHRKRWRTELNRRRGTSDAYIIKHPQFIIRAVEVIGMAKNKKRNQQANEVEFADEIAARPNKKAGKTKANENANQE
jgi:hypothetical protein